MMGHPLGVAFQMQAYRRGWRRTVARRAMQVLAVAVPVAVAGCVAVQVFS